MRGSGQSVDDSLFAAPVRHGVHETPGRGFHAFVPALCLSMGAETQNFSYYFTLDSRSSLHLSAFCEPGRERRLAHPTSLLRPDLQADHIASRGVNADELLLPDLAGDCSQSTHHLLLRPGLERHQRQFEDHPGQGHDQVQRERTGCMLRILLFYQLFITIVNSISLQRG